MGQHNSDKFFKVDSLITIKVCNQNHFSHFFSRKFTFKTVVRYVLKLLLSKVSFVCAIEHIKSFQKLIFGLGVFQFHTHKSEELRVIDSSVIILVDVLDDFFQLVLTRLESELVHDLTELIRINDTRVIVIKQLPGLLDLIFLFG